MPRVRRALSSTGIYHIIVRGINKQNIFVENGDNERFIDTLAGYQKEIEYEIYAYCLMGNHVHLLMKEGNEEIGNTMRRIGISYAYWYNWQYNRIGHLFQDRFKSEPVEDDAYFLTVLRYIHQNPVKAGLSSDIETYKWSSYKEYIKQAKIVNSNFVLAMFATERDKALARFRSFHLEANDDQCLDIATKRKTISDNEVRQLVLDKYNIELAKLHSLESGIQTEVLRYLKEKEGVSLRQLSRMTGFTVHRIFKVGQVPGT
ncbi:transposase [Syntrophomonas wolfei]|jgi:REP element-mobilizing transposase RayT|uniref:transposase n=1 Tax=Syntrophomonas wolfei TaxID=863 RepID=UPI0007744A73|nr:transposase [Syntrophomonas wolfei]